MAKITRIDAHGVDVKPIGQGFAISRIVPRFDNSLVEIKELEWQDMRRTLGNTVLKWLEDGEQYQVSLLRKEKEIGNHLELTLLVMAAKI